METTQQIFDLAYWASLAPAVQALAVAPENERYSMAESLALSGYKIDVPIMVENWDPFLCMNLRAGLGYTWVPSALQPPIELAPGLIQQGVPSYDPSNPPVGSIKVSVNLADYPPYVAVPQRIS